MVTNRGREQDQQQRRPLQPLLSLLDVSCPVLPQKEPNQVPLPPLRRYKTPTNAPLLLLLPLQHTTTQSSQPYPPTNHFGLEKNLPRLVAVTSGSHGGRPWEAPTTTQHLPSDRYPLPPFRRRSTILIAVLHSQPWDAEMMMAEFPVQRCKEVHGRSGGELRAKRLKGDCGIASTPRERKDKIGEKVAALQQLVSPFGKTDTASVLQEATGYIKFLHEQLEVLSAPYLKAPSPPPSIQGSSGASSDHHSLRSRGLCLVPVAHSRLLASSNGADIWAPNNTRSFKF